MVDLSCFFILFCIVLTCGDKTSWSKWQNKTIHLKAKKQKKEIEIRVPFKGTPLMTHQPPTRPFLNTATTSQEHQAEDHTSKI